MPAVRLSTISHVVLGMIALRGPSTPYDLKRAVAGSLGSWTFPHAQLYSEPDRLVDLGLLERHVEDSGRRRKTYSMTARGRRALREWLAAPVDEQVQVPDVAALKLYFSAAGDGNDVPALAREQVKQHDDRIAAFEAVAERLAGDPAAWSRATALELALEVEHAARRFWAALADGDVDRLRRSRRQVRTGP